MNTSTATADPPPFLSPLAISLRTGLSTDVIRKRIRTDPVLRGMFKLLGRQLVAEAAALPMIAERLAQKR
ncbi:hypothetical protein [Gemmata sp.]|uniref:hypothetical protein n=1 Tax=Gemmata sp. TaxID=1914242 RepID=UPI003F72CE32